MGAIHGSIFARTILFLTAAGFFIYFLIEYPEELCTIILIFIGLVAGAIVLFFLYAVIAGVIESRAEERRKEIIPQFKNIVGLPIYQESFDSNDSEEKVKEIINKCHTLEEELKQATDKLTKRELRHTLFNERLKAFYEYSIKGECKRGGFEQHYDVFYESLKQWWKTGDYNSFRIDMYEDDIIARKPDSQLEKLIALWEKDLKDDKIVQYTQQLDDIRKIDTSGFFSPSNSDKAEQMQSVYNAISAEAEEIAVVGKAIMERLNYDRMIAYRNSYLMMEVTNYLLALEEGKELVTEKSIADLNFDNFSRDITDFNHFSMETSAIISDTAKNFGDTFGLVRNLGFSRKGAMKGALVLSVAAAAIDEYRRKEEEAIALQKKIIKQIPKLCDQIHFAQAKLLDAIKIIRAINDANRAFIECYVPLRNNIFVTFDISKVQKQEVLALANVKERYVTISQTKISSAQPNVENPSKISSTNAKEKKKITQNTSTD